MSFTTAKLTELPFRNSLPLTSAPKLSFHFLKPFSSLRTTKQPHNHNTKNPKKWDPHNPKSRSTSAPWLQKWPHPSPNPKNQINKSNGHNSINQPKPQTQTQTQTQTPPPYFNKDKGQSAIERIVLRLRNLGLGSDDEEEEDENEMDGGDLLAVTGDEKLGDLLKREWVRPDTTLKEIENGSDDVVLPWEREAEEEQRGEEEGARGVKRRTAKAPTLAELTLEDEELRRLRRGGMYIRERISIPKAGITKEVLQKIHDKWRKEELVRLKFHEVLSHDMKTAHEIVERRTGGLVVWKSGSVMMVYRGSNYEGPSSKSQPADREGDALFVPDVSSANSETVRSDSAATSTPEKREPVVTNLIQSLNMTEEEAEYNNLLDGLGPRFEEW